MSSFATMDTENMWIATQFFSSIFFLFIFKVQVQNREKKKKNKTNISYKQSKQTIVRKMFVQKNNKWQIYHYH